MKVEVVPNELAPGAPTGRFDLILEGVRYSSFTEHALRDIEFVLAQRRAMSRRCPAVSGEHTCALAPQHGGSRHQCRGCDYEWQMTA